MEDFIQCPCCLDVHHRDEYDIDDDGIITCECGCEFNEDGEKIERECPELLRKAV